MFISKLTNDSLQAIHDTDRKITLGRNASIINTEIIGNLGIDDWSEIRHSTLGRHIGIGSFSSVSGVDMGNYCTVSARVALGRSEHPTNWLSVCEFQYRDTLSSRHESLPSRYRLDWDSSKRTTVGSDVWIGDSAIIKKGIELATGTIIGAGSVVTKSTDPYSIVVGNPAKPIRQRFEDTIIERLEV